jgi:multiple sugar transport system permease protein
VKAVVAEGSLAAPTNASATPRRRAPRLDELLPRWATFAPALLLMLALGVLPLINLLYTSFHTVSWSGGQATFTPVGFAHYANLPFDPLLRAGLGNTVLFALFAVAGQMVLGFALALLCSRVTRGRVFYRALFILPILVPGIVIGAIWKLMLNFDFGLINQVVELVGFEARNWLGDKETALASVIVVDIWHWTPFCFLLLLAGLESLPQDPYEAAKIDGASWWQELRFITLPLVIAFKVFDEVYLLTAGGPGTATEVLSFTLYQRFFREDRAGYGGAMAIAIMFICALLLVVALSVRRRSERSA